MKQSIWMAVTTDRLELPLAVADTARELGEMLGVSQNAICSRLCKGHSGKLLGYKIVKVEDIEE